MNFFEKMLIILDSSMKEPTMYGWFHIMFLILMISTIIFLAIKYKHPSEKQTKNVLLIYGVTCIVLEILKQINFSFNYEGINTWWSYQWYIFPYQFCSTPMYVALVAALTKNKKLQKSLYAFLATYGLIAGLSCMIYPSTVFIDTIFINIQTMVHHGSMVIIGMFMITSKSIDFNFKTIKDAAKVFIVLIMIALLIDISTYYIGIDNGLEMFFISPFHTSALPVFNIIYDKVPYIVFLIIYILSFTIGCSIPILIAKGCIKDKKKMQ